MIVQEFLIRHPNQTFDMMTPGGYVYLTPEKAQQLLAGESVSGHPGQPEYAMEISADEMLNQEICSSNFSDGAWHILSSCPIQPECAPTTMDQGVRMC